MQKVMSAMKMGQAAFAIESIHQTGADMRPFLKEFSQVEGPAEFVQLRDEAVQALLVFADKLEGAEPGQIAELQSAGSTANGAVIDLQQYCLG